MLQSKYDLHINPSIIPVMTGTIIFRGIPNKLG